ncbi:MAG: hypothetical protein JO085_04615 [Acidimicrobiia bacterium]|nr:hypothetical protein [Acidimicrobiia bacterium]
MARPRSWFIAAKSLVNPVTLIETFLPLGVVVVLEELLDDPPQAASTTANTAAIENTDIRRTETFIVPSRLENQK